MDKATLRSQFIALLNRSDITTQLADIFIDQGISRIQRTLRIPSMEAQHNYTFGASTTSINLPSDFLEAIDLYFGNRMLTRIPMKEMRENLQAAHAGAPIYFAREQGKFLLFPQPTSGTLTLNYYASHPDMVAETDENVLSVIASDLIIYAALTYASDYYIDDRAQLFEGKYLAFMNELQEQSDSQELSGTLQVIRPAYNY
jgi:hypothetical protein